MNLRVLTVADAELREAARWYENRRLGLGIEFTNAVEQVFEIIEQQPLRFPTSDESPDGVDVRECFVRGFPYIVCYEIRGVDVLVLAVAHAGRRPGYWRRRIL